MYTALKELDAGEFRQKLARANSFDGAREAILVMLDSMALERVFASVLAANAPAAELENCGIEGGAQITD